jgi:hypothetical protein
VLRSIAPNSSEAALGSRVLKPWYRVISLDLNRHANLFMVPRSLRMPWSVELASVT